MMMMDYKKTSPDLWTGRISDQKLYMHEKVVCIEINEFVPEKNSKTIALIGYACDEGVKRNQGRIGAEKGPDAIRKSLGRFPNHLHTETQFIDFGNILCTDSNLEKTQSLFAEKIKDLLGKNIFPIVLGGGHDVAFGHYNGIKKHIGDKKVGIINFDAHFDLRSNINENTSGTPFYQIAKDAIEQQSNFNYLCLGIRKDANDKLQLINQQLAFMTMLIMYIPQ